MEQKKNAAAFLRQRKLMLVIPLIALPFLLIIFVLLGGGRGSGLQARSLASYPGMNLKLPDAHFKKGREKDKLGFYEEAGKDSLKLKEAIKNDPYYKRDTAVAIQNIFERSASRFNQPTALKTSLNNKELADRNEEKLMEKLTLLKNELNKKTESDPRPYGNTIPSAYPQNPDLVKLENSLRAINTQNVEDPQLKQLQSMLDKILLIQHPEKVQDSLSKISMRVNPEPFQVKTLADFPDSSDRGAQNAFYGLLEESDGGPSNANGILAAVDQTQTLVSGAVVRLRLLEDIYIQGSLISKDQMAYGIANLSNERLKITIKSIRSHSAILPVALVVYDWDGLEGIYVPGSINRDVSKESTDQAISSIGIESLDPSLGAQAANAGIQAAKTLLSKKIKLVRVTVKAGYKVLLKDETKNKFNTF
jgi:conjugative transposon TraM protein